MSWGIDITATKETIAAELEAEKVRLTPLLAQLPTETEDMASVLDRAKFYAEQIDLDAYNAAWGRADFRANAIRVQAGGSHSTMGSPPKIGSASYRLDVSAVQLKEETK